MKTKIRITAILCALLILLSACAGGGTGDETATDGTTESTGIDTKETDSDFLDIFAVGDGAYTLIRPSVTTGELLAEFLKIKELMKIQMAAAIPVNDDWINPNKPLPEYEILVGNVDRDETRSVKESLGRNEYTVCAVGKKVVIVGSNEELTLLACDHFSETFLEGEKKQFPSDYKFVGKADYQVEDIKINGISIDQFKIVTTNISTYSSAVRDLKNTVRLLCGVDIPVVTSKENAAEHEIVFGNTGRDPEEIKYGYDDTVVYFKNGSLFLGGGSDWSVKVAVNYIKSLLAAEEKNIDIRLPEDGTPAVKLICPERSAYIADPSLLPMHWKYTWEPEEWMVNYEDKVNALMCNDKDHLFTVSHRADWLYYPENSIESIISVWAMGGDCVEIDIHYTADGIPVLMHDATLTRMTNFNSLKGHNGLPESADISAWTYEQICQLNLKEGAGGSSAASTPYKIPTLEEVLVACKDRLFIIVDKPDGWRYCDIPGIQQKSKEHYLYPIMEKANNFTSIMISYGTLDNTAEGTLSAAQALQIQKYVFERTGQKMFMFLRAWTTRSTVEPYAAALEKDSMTNSALIVNGAFDSTKAAAIKGYASKYPKTLMATWTIEDATDNESVWQTIYNAKIRSIMTNNMFGLVKFASTKK